MKKKSSKKSDSANNDTSLSDAAYLLPGGKIKVDDQGKATLMEDYITIRFNGKVYYMKKVDHDKQTDFKNERFNKREG
jgi:hypothetical protein